MNEDALDTKATQCKTHIQQGPRGLDGLDDDVMITALSELVICVFLRLIIMERYGKDGVAM